MTNLPASLIQEISSAAITCSFVVGPDGEIASASGNSKGLGNDTDLELLKTLRSHAEVVLTSGLTARLENYRMPKHADLAIFTHRGVAGLNLKPKAGQKLHILTPPTFQSYHAALSALTDRYQSIHIEFGPQGANELRDQIDLFVISGQSADGPKKFCEALQLSEIKQYSQPDLFITLATGRA